MSYIFFYEKNEKKVISLYNEIKITGKKKFKFENEIKKKKYHNFFKLNFRVILVEFNKL